MSSGISENDRPSRADIIIVLHLLILRSGFTDYTLSLHIAVSDLLIYSSSLLVSIRFMVAPSILLKARLLSASQRRVDKLPCRDGEEERLGFSWMMSLSYSACNRRIVPQE